MAREWSSDVGMALQFLAVFVSFAIRRHEPAGAAVAVIALLVAVLAAAVTWWALWHLGRGWRLGAVVTQDHELVVTGPYRWVRHPIYTAFLGMLGATILLITAWQAGITALILFVAGTEIRIRAEENLLARHFPDEFPSYRARTHTWLPPFR